MNLTLLPAIALFSISFSVSAAATSYCMLEDAIAGARFGARVSSDGSGGIFATATNRPHRFACGFDSRGLGLEVTARSGSGNWERYHSRWSLARIGRNGEVVEAGEGSVRANGCRVEIIRSELGITEWFENGPDGLEHGFDLKERPLPNLGGKFRLEMAVVGDLHPRLKDDGEGILLRDDDGRTVASYSKLVVWDATGMALPAEFLGGDGNVGIEVDDTGAVYPIVIDPLFRQEAYVKASNTGRDDAFGFSVALSGDTAVVGAPNEDSNATGFGGNQGSNSAMDAGAVYVFVRENGLWHQQAYLKASNTNTEDDFGFSVDIEGDRLIVGAPDESSSSSMINGNEADNTFASAGAVYVFTRDDEGLWSQEAYLKASNTGPGDQFGYSVRLSGNTVVVGAPFEDSNASGVDGDGGNNLSSSAGAAYVFVRSVAGTWTQQAYLKASNTNTSDTFGRAVDVSGNVIVVGAPAEDSAASGVNGNGSDNSLSNAGAAYVFSRTGTTWSQQAYLKASNPMAVDQFGMAVAVSGDRAVVGAPTEDGGGSGVNGNSGAAPQMNSGAAYAFLRVAGAWSQEAYLKASNAEAFDEFGHALALEGPSLAVAARLEDGAAIGIGGDQSDNAALSSGAVYVFERGVSDWVQRVYLKASNTDAGDEFGISLALSEDTLIVGASKEDSGTMGVNGNGATNNSSASGASYIFTGIRSSQPPFPVLAVPEVDGSGDWTVTWTSTPGASYTLERSHDFVTWVESVTLVATGSTSSHVETAADATEPTFWRVRSLCE
jgi:hypothetical protein